MEEERPTPNKRFEDMERIIDDAREVEFLYEQQEERAWREALRLKAPTIVSALREHLPAKVRQDVEQFLSTRYGCDCLRKLLQPTEATDGLGNESV